MLQLPLRSRWFATAVHLGLWLLLALTLARLGGTSLPYTETAAFTAPAQSIVPVGRITGLFDSASHARRSAPAGEASAFATAYFVPPAPPAPTTRKLEITYLGFYQTGDDPRRVFIKADNALRVSGMGDQIAPNLYVAAAAMQTLTMTNAAAETNVFGLNVKKAVEVPLR